MRERFKELEIEGVALLEVEVILAAGQHSAGVEIVLGIPGREGVVRRLWRAQEGRLNDDQVQDLSAWIVRAVQQALYRETGVQGSLPV